MLVSLDFAAAVMGDRFLPRERLFSRNFDLEGLRFAGMVSICCRLGFSLLRTGRLLPFEYQSSLAS